MARSQTMKALCCLLLAAALRSSTAAASKPLLGSLPLFGGMPSLGNMQLLGNRGLPTKLATPKQPAAAGSDVASTLAHPAARTSNPLVQATKPAVQATKPALQATKPALQASKPALQASKPALQATEPALQAADADQLTAEAAPLLADSSVTSQPDAAAVPNDGYFNTCTEALAKIPGYSHTSTALKNCPDLVSLQTDPSVVKTFFVPSNFAIESIAKHIGLPVQLLIGPTFKGVMCQFLRYHIADNKNMLADWTVGQALTTAYAGAQLTVVGVDTPQIQTKNGLVANVERVATCGSSVAFGIDEVLAPIAVPHLG